MSAADSSSVFFARVAELGLIDLKDRFTELGWTSFADFAFACSDFKGNDPELFKREVLEPEGGGPPPELPDARGGGGGPSQSDPKGYQSDGGAPAGASE